MNCTGRTEQIWLYCYGELPLTEAEELFKHIETCAACRAELERQRSFLRAVESARLEPPPELVASCRRELAEALLRPRGSESWRGRVANLFRLAGADRLRPPRLASSLALVAVGFLGGWLLANPQISLFSRSEPGGVRVCFIEHGPSGEVRLEIEESRRRWIRGAVAREPVRSLLVAAARDAADPAVRADALEALRQASESPEVRAVFVEALQRDPNPAIRLKALEGLRPYADDPQHRRVLAEALLRDADASVRVMAVELLAASRQPDIVETLQALLGRESDAYIRQRSAGILRAMNASPGIF